MVNLEKGFENLCLKNHKYLHKGQQLSNVYVSDETKKITGSYKRILLLHTHVIKKLLDSQPHLKKALIYKKLNSKEFEESHKIYSNFLKNPPKNASHDSICMYKTIWESVHMATMLDEISEGANDNVVLEQALVAMCAAYEYFLKETLKWTLDNFPQFSKKYLGSSSFPIKEAGRYDFDLIKNAGNLFIDKEGQNFKIFDSGKKLYKDIFNFNLFENEKHEKSLWMIFQTRHCIIHNGGEADAIWKRNMKNKKLKTDPKTLSNYIIIMHTEFHAFYFRLYKMLFKKDPSNVKETKEKLKLTGYVKFISK